MILSVDSYLSIAILQTYENSCISVKRKFLVNQCLIFLRWFPTSILATTASRITVLNYITVSLEASITRLGTMLFVVHTQ